MESDGAFMRIATEILISEYWNDIYTAAYSITRNRMDAEDAAQDAFVRYHMHKKQFVSKEHIRAWLFRVAINRAKDIVKRQGKKKRVSYEENIWKRLKNQKIHQKNLSRKKKNLC